MLTERLLLVMGMARRYGRIGEPGDANATRCGGGEQSGGDAEEVPPGGAASASELVQEAHRRAGGQRPRSTRDEGRRQRRG